MKVPFSSNYKNHFIVHQVHIEAKKNILQIAAILWVGILPIYFQTLQHIIIFQYVNKMCIHIYYNQVNCTSSINLMNNE